MALNNQAEQVSEKQMNHVNPRKRITGANHAKALFVNWALGERTTAQSLDVYSVDENLRKIFEMSTLIGALESLNETLYTVAHYSGSTPQNVFNGLLKENEKGFKTTFGSASEGDKSNGRVAIEELSKFLNARSQGKDYSVSLNDKLLSTKLNGATYLLSSSFLKDISASKQVNKKIDFLVTTYSNTVMMQNVLFDYNEENILETLDDSDYKTYSDFNALALILNATYNLAISRSSKSASNPSFVVQVPMLHLMKSLHKHARRMSVSELSSFVEDYGKEHSSQEEDNGVVLNTDSVAKGFELIKFPELSNDLTEAEISNNVVYLIEAIVFGLSYDINVNDLIFDDENSGSEFVEIFTYLMTYSLSNIGSLTIQERVIKDDNSKTEETYEIN